MSAKGLVLFLISMCCGQVYASGVFKGEKYPAKNPARSECRNDLLLSITAGQSIMYIQALLKKNYDPNYTDSTNLSVLTLAALRASYRVVKLLLENGAKINPEEQSFSALCAAVESKRPDVVGLLVIYGADPHFVSDSCELDTEKLLLCYGDDTAAAQQEGKKQGRFKKLTPLARARLRLAQVYEHYDKLGEKVADDTLQLQRLREKRDQEAIEYHEIVHILEEAHTRDAVVKSIRWSHEKKNSGNSLLL